MAPVCETRNSCCHLSTLSIPMECVCVCVQKSASCLRDVRESSLHTSIYSILTHLARPLSFSLLSPPSALSVSPPPPAPTRRRHRPSLVSVANDPRVGNLLWAAYAAPPKAKRKFVLNQIRWNFLSVVCTYRGRPGLAACFRLVLLSMMNLR